MLLGTTDIGATTYVVGFCLVGLNGVRRGHRYITFFRYARQGRRGGVCDKEINRTPRLVGFIRLSRKQPITFPDLVKNLPGILVLSLFVINKTVEHRNKYHTCR